MSVLDPQLVRSILPFLHVRVHLNSAKPRLFPYLNERRGFRRVTIRSIPQSSRTAEHVAMASLVDEKSRAMGHGIRAIASTPCKWKKIAEEKRRLKLFRSPDVTE